MKQGMTRKMKPKPKHEKKSWQKRNEARKSKQEAHQQQANQAPVLVESGVEVPQENA